MEEGAKKGTRGGSEGRGSGGISTTRRKWEQWCPLATGCSEGQSILNEEETSSAKGEGVDARSEKRGGTVSLTLQDSQKDRATWRQSVEEENGRPECILVWTTFVTDGKHVDTRQAGLGETQGTRVGVDLCTRGSDLWEAVIHTPKHDRHRDRRGRYDAKRKGKSDAAVRGKKKEHRLLPQFVGGLVERSWRQIAASAQWGRGLETFGEWHTIGEKKMMTWPAKQTTVGGKS